MPTDCAHSAGSTGSHHWPALAGIPNRSLDLADDASQYCSRPTANDNFYGKVGFFRDGERHNELGNVGFLFLMKIPQIFYVHPLQTHL